MDLTSNFRYIITNIRATSAVALGIREVKGLSVTNFNIRPKMKVAVPTNRKVLISKELSLNINETTRAAPITDIRDISANTDERKENKYKEAMADRRIQRSMNILVNFTVNSDDLSFIRAANTPNAKALESIVPINAAISETRSNEPSHTGKAPRTPSVKRFDGSVTTPANLKLMPR